MRLQKLLVEENFEIKKLTSFKIGGKVKKIYFPETVEEFVNILQNEPEAVVVGNLSNTLISSNGYDGVLISTSKMNKIEISGTTVVAGAGVKGPKLSQTVAKEHLSGLEFMIGFPGSVGGEVFMNAGAHGQCIADSFKCAKVYSLQDGLVVLKKEDMEFEYRTSICQKKNFTVLEVEFELVTKPIDEIQTKMDENLTFRKTHQPSLALPNCGSIFRNPEGNSAGRLLDKCNVKGLQVGGVRVWENHANFIVNDGDGTSDDVINLMKEMQKRVKEKFNIKLVPEIRYLGKDKLWLI
jgi:UDP-N-acetylmuramate dehydrogenase